MYEPSDKEYYLTLISDMLIVPMSDDKLTTLRAYFDLFDSIKN